MKVILSMTTIPSRATIIEKTLESLLQQTYRFDELRVYTPPGVHMINRSRITICPCEDHGPVTKISAVCDSAVPDDALVITVDDDIVYDRDWLSTLVDGSERNPEDACGFKGWDITDFLANPASGDFLFMGAPKTCDVLEGFAGVAYRKRWFSTEILQPPDYARYVDDVWISSQLQRRGIVRRLIVEPHRMAISGNNPGLHRAVDFKAQNREAAVALFGSGR